MKKLFCVIVIGLFVQGVEAADVTVEACVSVEITSQPTPDLFSGFSEQCINMSETAIAEADQLFDSHSDEKRFSFAWGGCNVTGMSQDITIEIKWRYSIITNAQDGERATAVVTFRQVPEPYTTGSGSFSTIVNDTIVNNICFDGLETMSASVEVAAGLDEFVLSNDFGINGLFADPNNDFNGFDFNVHEFGLTVFYYGHTASGERLWLISQLYTEDLSFAEPVQLNMFEVGTGVFGQSSAGETLWGTLDFTLNDCESVDATLNGTDGTAMFALVRIAGSHGRGCQ